MAKFGKVSQERLATCDQRLQDLFNEVIKYVDCTVLCGHRDEAAQNEAVRTGKSRTRWPTSKHNSKPSMAVDAAPYPVDWNDKHRFYYFAGFVVGVAKKMGIKVRYGGDWDSDFDLNDQSFIDLPHFELVE